jgi:predicted ATPase
MNTIGTGTIACGCSSPTGAPRRIVLTGGPGAGKTAVLEMLRRSLCEHVAVLPESASIIFGGGFPRGGSDAVRRGAQRAIFRVQSELEQIVLDEARVALALCDRGTVDGVAYWPGETEKFFEQFGSTRAAEFARYDMVVHLRTPPEEWYDHSNELRIESAREAAAIDQRIEQAWAEHPNRRIILPSTSFLDKAAKVIELVRAEMPPCCRQRTGAGAD